MNLFQIPLNMHFQKGLTEKFNIKLRRAEDGEFRNSREESKYKGL